MIDRIVRLFLSFLLACGNIERDMIDAITNQNNITSKFIFSRFVVGFSFE